MSVGYVGGGVDVIGVVVMFVAIMSSQIDPDARKRIEKFNKQPVV